MFTLRFSAKHVRQDPAVHSAWGALRLRHSLSEKIISPMQNPLSKHVTTYRIVIIEMNKLAVQTLLSELLAGFGLVPSAAAQAVLPV